MKYAVVLLSIWRIGYALWQWRHNQLNVRRLKLFLILLSFFLILYILTGPSIIYAKKIAQDKNLDLTRIRRMLESKKDDEIEKAFEILYLRRSFADLVYFQDLIPESEFRSETSKYVGGLPGGLNYSE